MSQPQLTGNVGIAFDTHAYHLNLVRGTSKWPNTANCRDFDTPEQMNKCMLDGINKRLKKRDTLILGGDVAFGGYQNVAKFIAEIECQNKILIFGNHDGQIRKRPELRSLFSWVGDYLEIKIHGQFCVFCHYPFASWNHMEHCSWMIHGHCHNNLKEDSTLLRHDADIYRRGGRYSMHPYMMPEIAEIMATKTPRAVDHHGGDTPHPVLA